MTLPSRTPALHQLQASFAAALRYEEQGGNCLIKPGIFSPEQQLQLYRNNFIISLSEVLGATYPLVYQLVGDTCFAQLARRYVLSVPLQEGNVWGYGKGFALTIQQTELVISAVPYLGEIARLEWAMDELNRQQYPQENPATYSDLGYLEKIAADKYHLIRFRSLRNMVLFESDFAVFSIRNAVLTDSFDDVEPGQPEYGAIVSSTNKSEPIRITPLSHQQKQLLKQIQRRKCLGELEPELLVELNTLVQLGLVIGFTIGDNEYDH